MRHPVAALVWVFLVGLAAGCANDDQAKRAHFDRGDRLFKEGKNQEAILELRNAVQLDANYGEARLRLADAYTAIGNGEAAYREYIRAADLLPGDDTAQVKAAAVLLLSDQAEDARTRLQTVVDRNPSNVQAQILLGNALSGLKDLDGAVRQIESAIQLQPTRGQTYSNLAAIQLARGRQDDARAAFQKGVEVDPRSITAWHALGHFQWSTGDLAGAEASFTRAVEIDPEHAQANRVLAAFYIDTGRGEAAEPFLKRMADSGVPQASFLLADYYISVARFDDAVTVLEPLTKVPDRAGDAEARLASIAYRQNDRARAHDMLDAVIRRERSNAPALLLKSTFLRTEGKWAEARSRAQDAVKADPNLAAAHFALGTLHIQMREQKEAMAAFNEVLRINPRDAAAQVYLSSLNLRAGTPDAAVSLAEDALATMPESPQARTTLVRGLIAKRDVERAEKELATLTEKFPKVGLVRALEGTVKALKNDLAGARTSYEQALALAPSNLEALAGLTVLDLQQGKAAAAQARVDARLAAQPDQPDVLQLAARVAIAQRDLPKAESLLRRAIRANPAADAAYPMLAEVLMRARKLDAALVEFDAMAQRNPADVAARTMAAMIVHGQNKVADAKTRYEAILKLSPGAPVAANNLAWIHAEEGQRLDEALRLARDAERSLPESPQIQDTIGWIYVKQELPALAVPAFQKSLEQVPGNPTYHFHLAVALQKAGDPPRARQAAELALKLRPSYTEAKQLLASLRTGAPDQNTGR